MSERHKDPIRIGMQGRISLGREVASNIDQQLKELNENYPGQRHLPRDKQDEEFKKRREELLAKKWTNATTIHRQRRALKTRLGLS